MGLVVSCRWQFGSGSNCALALVRLTGLVSFVWTLSNGERRTGVAFCWSTPARRWRTPAQNRGAPHGCGAGCGGAQIIRRLFGAIGLRTLLQGTLKFYWILTRWANRHISPHLTRGHEAGTFSARIASSVCRRSWRVVPGENCWARAKPRTVAV